MKTLELAPFLGAHTSADPRQIAPTSAQDMRNVRTGDGALNVRYGYNNLRAAQSGFSSVLAFDYVQGYNNSYALVEEYISAETISSNTRLFSRNVTTGAPTEIKNGSTSVNLTPAEGQSISFNGNAYFFNGTDTLVRHAIGDNTSLVSLAVPVPPAAAPTYTVIYGGGINPYNLLSFAGINVSSVTGTHLAVYTGVAAPPSVSTATQVNTDGTIDLANNATTGDGSITLDLEGSSAGVQDFSFNDAFALGLSCKTSSFDIDPTLTTFTFINKDGSPISFVPDLLENDSLSGGGATPPGTGKVYHYRFQFNNKTRADWDNIAKVTIAYHVRSASSTRANNVLTISKPYIGGVMMQSPVAGRLLAALYIGYSYYFSTPQLESGISPLLFIPPTILSGSSPYPTLAGLGVQLQITMVTPVDTNVDYLRIYQQDEAQLFHRLGEQVKATLTFKVEYTYPEVLNFPAYTIAPFTFANIIGAFSYHGSIVWLYKGGYQNVRYSRVGEPERLANVLVDLEDDLNRGSTWSLAENFGDEPVGGIQAADAAIIVGRNGVYAQTGPYPSAMTPPKKVPGSYGCAGRYAFIRWKDDRGNPGLVYLSTDGQVWFVVIDPQFSGDEGSTIIRLSEKIRTGPLSPQTYLLDGQVSALSLTDFSTSRLTADEASDTLWVFMGTRALCLRPANTITGEREWEAHDFNTSGSTVTIKYVSSSSRYRTRWMRSNGLMDENEWNNSSRAFISGANRDGGNAIASIYWQSKTFEGGNSRIMNLECVRDSLSDTPTVTVTSTRQTQAYTFASGSRFKKTAATQQGFAHSHKIALAETSGAIRMLKWSATQAGKRFTS